MKTRIIIVLLVSLTVVACDDDKMRAPTTLMASSPTPTIFGGPHTGYLSPHYSAHRWYLSTLYNATDGSTWAVSDNWLSDELLGAWYGVSADEYSSVIELDLAGNQLRGEIPVELSYLVNLEVLNLARNELRGEIPTALVNLGNLRVLYLGDNQFTGCIPDALMAVKENDLTSLGLEVCGVAGVTTPQPDSTDTPAP